MMRVLYGNNYIYRYRYIYFFVYILVISMNNLGVLFGSNVFNFIDI